MGTEGPYDDLELTVTGGQLQITKAPFVPVSCFEMGGASGSLSFELFAAPGPWTIGTDGLVAKQGIAVNQLVSERRPDDQLQGHRLDAAGRPGGGNTGDLVLRLQVRHLHQHHHLHQLRRLQSFEAVPA